MDDCSCGECLWLDLFMCAFLCVPRLLHIWGRHIHTLPICLWLDLCMCVMSETLSHIHMGVSCQRHSPIFCSTLQHTATHCNTLQHTVSCQRHSPIFIWVHMACQRHSPIFIWICQRHSPWESVSDMTCACVGECLWHDLYPYMNMGECLWCQRHSPIFIYGSLTWLVHVCHVRDTLPYSYGSVMSETLSHIPFVQMCHVRDTLPSCQRHSPIFCNTLQHTATHCNTLQHTATHCVMSETLSHIHMCNLWRSESIFVWRVSLTWICSYVSCQRPSPYFLRRQRAGQHNSFTRVTWRIHMYTYMCDMTHAYVHIYVYIWCTYTHVSNSVTRRIQLRDMMRSWHAFYLSSEEFVNMSKQNDLFVCATWRMHMYAYVCIHGTRTHTCEFVRLDASKCVTWRVHMCDRHSIWVADTLHTECCSVLQCVAVCCSMLQWRGWQTLCTQNSKNAWHDASIRVTAPSLCVAH